MKIGIVGAGLVGATCAYTLVMRGIGREIVLIDAAKKRAQAQANDIFHAVPFAHPLRVIPGEFSDLKGSQVVIMSAGVSQKPGEPRIELLSRNSAIFADIIPRIVHYAPDAIIVVATNPVDIMTHIAAHYAQKNGVPFSRVIGSGTMLDTARLRTLLGILLAWTRSISTATSSANTAIPRCLPGLRSGWAACLWMISVTSRTARSTKRQKMTSMKR